MSDVAIRISANPNEVIAAFVQMTSKVTELERKLEGLNGEAKKSAASWTEFNQSLESARKAIGATFGAYEQGIKLLEAGGGLHEQRTQLAALAGAHGLASSAMVKDIKEISEGNVSLADSFSIASKAAVTGLNREDTRTVLEYSKKWAEAAGRPFLEVAEKTTSALATGKMKSLKEMDELFAGVTSKAEGVKIMRAQLGQFAEVDFSGADKIGSVATSLKDFHDRLGEAINGSPEVQRALSEMAAAAERFVTEFKYEDSVAPVVRFLDTVYEKSKAVAGGLDSVSQALGGIPGIAGTALVGAGGYYGAKGAAGLSEFAVAGAEAAAAARLARAASPAFAATAATAALPAGSSAALVDAVAAFAPAEAAAAGGGLAGLAAGASSVVAGILASPAVLTAMIAGVGYLIYNGPSSKQKEAPTGPIVRSVPAEMMAQVTEFNASPKRDRDAKAGILTEEQRKDAAKGFKDLLEDRRTALQDSLRDQETEAKRHNDRVLEGFKDRIEAENEAFKKQTDLLKRQQDERQRELEKRQRKDRSEFERMQAAEAENFKKTGAAPRGSIEERLAAFREQDAKKYGGPSSFLDTEEIAQEKFRRRQEQEKLTFTERIEAEKKAMDLSFKDSELARDRERDARVKEIEKERDAKRLEQDDVSRATAKATAARLRQFDRDARDVEEAAKESGYRDLRLPPGVRSLGNPVQLATGQARDVAGVPVEDPARILATILALLQSGVSVSSKGGDKTDAVLDLLIDRASIRAKLDGTTVAAAN